MKYIILILFIAFIISAGSSGCVNHSEEELYGLECDTTNLTYSKIKYIFENNCYRCHNETTNYHSIIVSSYDKLKAAVNTGKLQPAINHTGEFKMPKDRTEKLDDCLIAMIEAWINGGMPE